MNGKVAEKLRSLEGALVELRRDLHRHPELSGEEERTAGVVAERLRELGLEVETGVAGHGVVAVLKGGRAGTLLAGRDRFQVTLSGEGDLGKAAAAVGEILAGVSTLTREEAMAPQTEDFFVVQVFRSEPEAGEKRWVLTGMATTTSGALREKARGEIRRKLETLAADGVLAELDYEPRIIPGAFNDPELEKAARETIRGVVGEQGLVPIETVIPLFSEDFGWFQDEAPGVMYFLGVSNPGKGTVGMPHSPQYVADEESIGVGARAMAAVILDYLESRLTSQGGRREPGA